MLMDIFQANSPFDLKIFTPRALGGLQHERSCSLHGWSAMATETRRDMVVTWGSQMCDSASPHLFCSIFNTNTHRTCNARLGSAVICDLMSISGIVVNEGSCSTIGSSALLSYHSVAEFQDWILQVSGAKSFPTLSGALIALLVFMNFRVFV